MSWAAHDLEPYTLQRHLGIKTAFFGLLLGSYSPDIATKWFVYGVDLFGWELKASDPVQFHRGWPGAGFTHSLLFGLVAGLLIWAVFRSVPWALGFTIGQWAHALTDIGDTVGSMLFFPWTENIHIDAWAYAGHTGRYVDAAAYHSGLGGMWDLVWIVLGLLGWRVLTREHFVEVVLAGDGLARRAARLLPVSLLLVLYRSAFFYGACRWTAWTIWAHVIHDYPYDLSWGGPHWVDAEHPR